MQGRIRKVPARSPDHWSLSGPNSTEFLTASPALIQQFSPTKPVARNCWATTSKDGYQSLRSSDRILGLVLGQWDGDVQYLILDTGFSDAEDACYALGDPRNRTDIAYYSTELTFARGSCTP
jgi:hypothetical protein